MEPTRKRDLLAGIVVTAVVSWLLVRAVYRWFPPITVWTGVSLLAVAVALAAWGSLVRTRIRDGDIGVGQGRMHPLAVARSVLIAKASAWVGSVVFGWWLAVVVFLLPRRSTVRVAAEDTAGAVVAGLCALALIAAALWLQHCCRSPEDSTPNADATPG
jgi:Protein of unknown function (DUF3180)